MSSTDLLAQRIFDSVVRKYDWFLNSATFGLINQWQLELVNNLPGKEIFVDLGTGTGEIVKKVNIAYPESKVIGIDVAINMLRKAIEKTEGDARDFFIRASALKMPFKDESVDVITTSLTFRHLPLEEAIQEIFRVLKPGGYFGILDISKPKSKALYKVVDVFANKIFKPIGVGIFSKEEYAYFMESIEKALTPEELKDIMEANSFVQEYQNSRFFGLINISVFRKTY